MVYCCQEKIWLCQENCESIHHTMMAYKGHQQRRGSAMNTQGEYMHTYPDEQYEDEMIEDTYNNDEQLDMLQVMSSMNKTDRRKTISAFDTKEI